MTLFRGSLQYRAQGPCGHLPSESVHQSWSALTARRRTNNAVESRRSTAADTIFPEGLYSALFDDFVASEAREVVTGKIENLLSRVCESRHGTICTGNYGYGREVDLFFRSEWGTQGLWYPFIDEFVDLLSNGDQRDDVGTQQTDLFRTLNKMFFAVVCTNTGLKSANGEEDQEYFENYVTGVVLVGRLDIASNNMGTRYFIKDELCLYKSVGKKGEEFLERRLRKDESANHQDIVSKDKVDLPPSDLLPQMYCRRYLVRHTLRGNVPFG